MAFYRRNGIAGRTRSKGLPCRRHRPSRSAEREAAHLCDWATMGYSDRKLITEIGDNETNEGGFRDLLSLDRLGEF